MRWTRLLVAGGVLVFSLGLLLHTLLDANGWSRRTSVRTDLAALTAENARLQEEVASLRAQIKAMRTRREYQDRVIRDELGHLGPNELCVDVGAAAPPVVSPTKP